MRKIKKKFKKPLRPWDKERIEEERKLMKKFGLKRKREIYKARSIIRTYRQRARTIQAKSDKEGEKILIEKLYKMGILKSKDSTLDAVLGLTIEDLLERRLQSIVFKMGLANTPLHARQLITHGKIAINDRRVIFPSYLVPVGMEKEIKYYGGYLPKNQEKVESQNQSQEIQKGE